MSFFFLILIFCVGNASAEQVKDLKPQGYVNDFAGVLSGPAKEKITALCAEVDRKAGAQIAVVTVSSLGGESVEQSSIDLATQWGVGPKQQARGILILLAPNDRKYRIEVGYGLEPILPDGKVGGFGREAVPFLQRNDYGGATLLMTQRVAAVIAEDRKVTLDLPVGAVPSAEPNNALFRGPNILGIIIFVIFLFFPILGFILRLLFGGGIVPRRGGSWMGGGYGGGSWGGGGFGGGGGGGGGFGGFGGGSFGGGGASGSW